MIPFRYLVLAVAVLVPFSVAQAAIIIKTSLVSERALDFDSGLMFVDGFDSSLGTLTAVRIDYGFLVDGQARFLNDSTAPANLSYRAEYHAFFDFHGLESIAGEQVISFATDTIRIADLRPGSSLYIDPFQFFDQRTIIPLDLDEFVDRDFSYTMTTLFGSSHSGAGNVSYSVPSSGQGYVTATYTYDAFASAIPEPATWAMLIFGFGLVGVAIRRQRGNPASIV